MANHKRKKTRRNVRCTMCTPDRWKGNSKDRHNFSTRKRLEKGKDIQFGAPLEKSEEKRYNKIVSESGR